MGAETLPLDVVGGGAPHDPAPRPAIAAERRGWAQRNFDGRELRALVGITLLAAAMRLYQLGEWSLWVDEAHTYRDVMKPAAEFWKSGVGAYPLSYLLLRGLVALGMPTSEGWLRLPFAFFGILSVPLLGLLGRSLVGPRAALLAAALLAVSPWHIFWSQNARSYAMVLFLVLLAASVFYRGVQRRESLWLWLSLVLTIVAGLCHPSAYIVLGGYATYGALLLRRGGARAGRLQQWLPLIVLVLMAVLLLLFLPLLEYFKRVKPDFSLMHLLQTLAFFVRLPLVAAALGGLLWLADRDDPAAAFLGAWIVVPVLVLAVLALGFCKVTAQYAFYTLPAFCLLAASVVQALAQRVSGTGFRGHLLRAVPLLVLVLDMVGQSYLYFERYHGERPRWRDACRFLQDRPGETKRVITTNQPSLGYYLDPHAFTGPPATGAFKVEVLADYMLHDGGERLLEQKVSAARADGVELYVVVTEPELYEMDPRGEVDAYLRSHFKQVRWLPNWTGPKDMNVLIYYLDRGRD